MIPPRKYYVSGKRVLLLGGGRFLGLFPQVALSPGRRPSFPPKPKLYLSLFSIAYYFFLLFPSPVSGRSKVPDYRALSHPIASVL
jgi:hypothetical protein